MTRIHTLSIRIEGPDHESYPSLEKFDEANQNVVDSVRSAIPDIEDVVNDQLPDGFYCKVED